MRRMRQTNGDAVGMTSAHLEFEVETRGKTLCEGSARTTREGSKSQISANEKGKKARQGGKGHESAAAVDLCPLPPVRPCVC